MDIAARYLEMLDYLLFDHIIEHSIGIRPNIQRAIAFIIISGI